MLGVLKAAEQYLASRDVDAPRLSVEWMLAEVLQMDRLRVYLAHDRPLAGPELERLRSMVARRGRHEPLAYILGHWEFMGHELQVSPDVLVPRPETEGLAELAIERAPRDSVVVDMGTGSGAIAVAVGLARPDLQILATDISSSALEIARKNVERHGLSDRVRFLQGSFGNPLREFVATSGQVGTLVSNPPYVDPDREDLYDRVIADHEPHTALFTAPGDVAQSYREILLSCQDLIVPGGLLLLETGVGADKVALQLLQDACWLEKAELRCDLAGLPRYLLASVTTGRA